MEEKKTKLDELPDEGGPSSPSNVGRIKPKPKQAPDPRLERLSKLDEDEKVSAMNEGWHFDKPVALFGWLAYVLIVLAAQFSGTFDAMMAERQLGKERLDELSGIEDVFLTILTDPLDIIVKYPVIFLILIPFFFKFRQQSDFYFDINFDGLSTVRKVAIGAKEMPSRIFLKWKEITRAEKGVSGHRDVLKLYSPDGLVGEVIWDIDGSKKDAVAHVLKGLVPKDHALRKLFEKEIE